MTLKLDCAVKVSRIHIPSGKNISSMLRSTDWVKIVLLGHLVMGSFLQQSLPCNVYLIIRKHTLWVSSTYVMIRTKCKRRGVIKFSYIPAKLASEKKNVWHQTLKRQPLINKSQKLYHQNEQTENVSDFKIVERCKPHPVISMSYHKLNQTEIPKSFKIYMLRRNLLQFSLL